MKYFKSIFFLFFSILFFTDANSFNLNNIYNIKTVSASNLEINDTNLVEEENAENLLSNNNDLKQSLIEKSGEIRKKNKNRKRKRTKGGVEIFEDYSNSVVFIGNRVKGKIKTVGSGFIISHNGPKIITNWHVIEGADTIHIWLNM